MYYQKDWLIRQIEQMVSALMQYLTLTTTPQQEAWNISESLRSKTLNSLAQGEVCEAENMLYETWNPEDPQWLQEALSFYTELSTRSDSWLEEHNFSRDEIAYGLEEICKSIAFPLLGGEKERFFENNT